jgi:Spy/CpxP family protein refolding chaperone
MNRLHKMVLGGAALALAGVIAGNVPVATGQDSGETSNKMHGRRMHRGGGAPLISIALKHQSELNLTREQVANLEKIKSHYESQVTPLLQQLATSEKEIAALTQQSPAQLISLKSKIQESEKYRTELRYLRLEALENGRSVLTPQQQEQLKTLARARHDRFRKQRGPSGQPS